MATTYHNAIQQLYVAYFNRPADVAGLAYWEGVVEAAAGDTTAVSAAFAASAEYQAAYEDLNTTGILRQIYRNLFNAEADDAGLAFWANAVSTGAMSIDVAVTNIAAGAQGVHKETFENKVLAAEAFTAALDTTAEAEGYSGDLANAAAKVWLATITTDASLTAAIAPAVLAETVSDVIKAGVEFTLTGALASYTAAVEARDAFLVEADGDDSDDTSLEVDVAQAAIDAKFEALGFGYDATGTVGVDANSPGVNAALLADEIDARADALTAAQADLKTKTAAVAKVANLSAYVAAVVSATAAQEAAAEAAADTQATLDGALVTYETKSATTLVDTGNGTFGVDGGVDGNGDPIVTPLIVKSGTTVALATGVTETTNPGVTALLTAAKADLAADKALATANTNLSSATVLMNRTDVAVAAADELLAVGAEMGLATGVKPTAVQIQAEILARNAALAAAEASVAATVAAGGTPTTAQTDAVTAAKAEVDAFTGVIGVNGSTIDGVVTLFDRADNFDPLLDNPLADAYLAAVANVAAKSDAVDDLNDVVAEQAELDVIVAELDALNDAIADAEEVFADNEFAVPVTLTAFVAGTEEADIFVVGSGNSTVLNFGADDQLFIGTEYTLNAGPIATAGNNAVLEVFMTQSGANTIITLETETFGSNSADAEIVITLTGVNVADVTLANGIISI